MAAFLWDEFGVLATKSSISRALASKGWSKKTTQRRAREQNLDLRDAYSHDISEFHSYILFLLMSLDVIAFLSEMHLFSSVSDTACICSRWHCPFKSIPGTHWRKCFWGFYWQLLQHCGNGRSPSLFWSWTMPLSIILSGLSRCASMQELNWCICHSIHLI